MRFQQLLFLLRLLILDFLYLLSSDVSDSLLLLDFLYFLSSANKICSMMRPRRMVLIRTIFPIFLCVFTILLVVLVAWGLAFFTNRSWSQMWYFSSFVFVPIGVEYKGGQLIKTFFTQIHCSLYKYETQFYSYINGLTSPHSLLPLSLHQKHDMARFYGIHL